MSNDARDSSASRPSSGSQPDWEAIARYLAGESPSEEAGRVQRWLEVNPSDRALVEQLDTAATFEPASVDVEAALAKVHRNMQQQEPPRLTVERGGAARGQPARRTPIVAIAVAAAAAAAAFTAVLLNTRSTSTKSEIGPPVASIRTYTTPVGKRDSINLPDGSRVILGPDSRLTVASSYGDSTRSVELRGDAYFDVKHDVTKLFSVRVGQALIEDIGTTFAVESDAGDTTTVAVVSGSVRLRPMDSPATSGAVLAAGDRGSMAADGKVRAYPHTVAGDTSWTTGHLVFTEASVARIVGEIHRWYGVELRVSDTALLNKHVSTSFNSDESVDQALKILGLALGASVERHGDSATLSSAHGPATVR